jgi:1,4-dihydroxy-2-naphthoate octaprenyltransferase
MKMVLRKLKNSENNKLTIGALGFSAAYFIPYTNPYLIKIVSYKVFGMVEVGLLLGIVAIYAAFMVYNGRT